MLKRKNLTKTSKINDSAGLVG